MTELSIEVSGLYKSFGPTPVLENGNLTTEANEIQGIIGPNGEVRRRINHLLQIIEQAGRSLPLARNNGFFNALENIIDKLSIRRAKPNGSTHGHLQIAIQFRNRILEDLVLFNIWICVQLLYGSSQ